MGVPTKAMWYVDRIVQTFNRVAPGSISEMMPDYGCFTIAWTSYGIVLPLIEHVFGVRPDAANKTIVFEPHLPTGWEDISIEDLPVGANLVSFSRPEPKKRSSTILQPETTAGASFYDRRMRLRTSTCVGRRTGC